MEFLFDASRADPWILWMWRGLFLLVAGYTAWCLLRHGNKRDAFWGWLWQSIAETAAKMWEAWGPLLKSRAFIGGAVMFLSWRADKTIPPEAQGFLVEIIIAALMTLGLLFVLVGRMFAKGPIHLPAVGLLSPGARDEMNAHARREFAQAESDYRAQGTLGGILGLEADIERGEPVAIAPEGRIMRACDERPAVIVGGARGPLNPKPRPRAATKSARQRRK